MAHVAVRDPFWFMRAMFRWGSSSIAPAFDVAETKDAYVYKATLTLPGQVDAGHLKAELDNGQLTLVVPKVASLAPAPVPTRNVERRKAVADQPRVRLDGERVARHVTVETP